MPIDNEILEEYRETIEAKQKARPKAYSRGRMITAVDYLKGKDKKKYMNNSEVRIMYNIPETYKELKEQPIIAQSNILKYIKKNRLVAQMCKQWGISDSSLYFRIRSLEKQMKANDERAAAAQHEMAVSIEPAYTIETAAETVTAAIMQSAFDPSENKGQIDAIAILKELAELREACAQMRELKAATDRIADKITSHADRVVELAESYVLNDFINEQIKRIGK